jgi:hypothetical protein
MINIENTPEPEENEPQQPDESQGIVVTGFLKIHDPETGEIIVQGRA